jgi:hypothetical protein
MTDSVRNVKTTRKDEKKSGRTATPRHTRGYTITIQRKTRCNNAEIAEQIPNMRRHLFSTNFSMTGTRWNKRRWRFQQNCAYCMHLSAHILLHTSVMLQAVTPEQAAQHTRKPHNTKRARADGMLLRKRDGQTAYIEYAAPFGVLYIPSMENSPEQIQCRSGDSCITIEGCNLWPLFEDLQAKLCELVQESEYPSQATLGVLHVERITVRLWL